jgi:cytochrome c peroxidase
MSVSKFSSRVVALASKRPTIWGAGAAAVVTLLASVAVAQTVSQQPPTTAFFAVYPDAQGSLTTNSTDPSTLNTKNPFFDPSIGTNGQACVTCHEPFTGITITVPFINQQFVSSGGTDPLFRLNDTANNPFGIITLDNPDNFSLIKNLGVVRIGKTIAAGANFTVVANAVTNEIFATGGTGPNTFPLTNDPQHAGTQTLSVFRRPLVNTNVNFDSAVLWDGRANIENLGGVAPLGTPAFQVESAIQTLLLGPGKDPTVNDAIADFMTGVYTDQKSSDVAGELTAVKATGGLGNLVALSESPNRPCVFDEDTPPDLTPFVLATGSTATQGLPNSCTPVKVGPNNGTFNLFSSWLSLPNTPANVGRLSVARGEVVFNTASAGGAGGFGCATCHAVNNLGNNPSATTFFRDGTESPTILQTVLATAEADGNAAEIQMVKEMIDLNNQLPLYCLRPTGNTTPCTPTNPNATTDPGRALVSGLIAQIGDFKPPILRNLAVRAPFFHAGVAADSPPGAAMQFTAMQHLVNFYTLHFNFGTPPLPGQPFKRLTAAEQADLVNFLNAL